MTTAVSPEPARAHIDHTCSLDQSDLHLLCTLVSRGCTVQEAARWVGCKLAEIRHQRDTNDAFRRQLAQAKMKAKLAPLRAMQRAMKKDWRAAAWFLERTQPEKFARRNHRAFTQKQVNALIKDITSIVGEESVSKVKIDRTSSRVEAAIRYAFHAHNDMNRTAAELDNAMHHHDMKSPRYCPTLTDFSVIPPLASGASPNLPPPTPAVRTQPTGGTDCRPNVINNRTGPTRPIVGAAQPQEAMQIQAHRDSVTPAARGTPQSPTPPQRAHSPVARQDTPQTGHHTSPRGRSPT